jgi:hypothetical protein
MRNVNQNCILTSALCFLTVQNGAFGVGPLSDPLRPLKGPHSHMTPICCSWLPTALSAAPVAVLGLVLSLHLRLGFDRVPRTAVRAGSSRRVRAVPQTLFKIFGVVERFWRCCESSQNRPICGIWRRYAPPNYHANMIFLYDKISTPKPAHHISYHYAPFFWRK